MMCAFHESNCHGFGDNWWTDKCTYFSSIDKLFFFLCFIFLCYYFLNLKFVFSTYVSIDNTII